jgi:hypothetical protein
MWERWKAQPTSQEETSGLDWTRFKIQVGLEPAAGSMLPVGPYAAPALTRFLPCAVRVWIGSRSTSANPPRTAASTARAWWNCRPIAPLVNGVDVYSLQRDVRHRLRAALPHCQRPAPVCRHRYLTPNFATVP